MPTAVGRWWLPARRGGRVLRWLFLLLWLGVVVAMSAGAPARAVLTVGTIVTAVAGGVRYAGRRDRQ